MTNIASEIEVVASKIEDSEKLISILSDYFDDASGEASPIAMSCFYGRAETYHALVHTLWDFLVAQRETLDALSKEISAVEKENVA